MVLKKIEWPEKDELKTAHFESMTIDREGHKRFTIIAKTRTIILHVPPQGEATWREKF